MQCIARPSRGALNTCSTERDNAACSPPHSLRSSSYGMPFLPDVACRYAPASWTFLLAWSSFLLLPSSQRCSNVCLSAQPLFAWVGASGSPLSLRLVRGRLSQTANCALLPLACLDGRPPPPPVAGRPVPSTSGFLSAGCCLKKTSTVRQENRVHPCTPSGPRIIASNSVEHPFDAPRQHHSLFPTQSGECYHWRCRRVRHVEFKAWRVQTGAPPGCCIMQSVEPVIWRLMIGALFHVCVCVDHERQQQGEGAQQGGHGRREERRLNAQWRRRRGVLPCMGLPPVGRDGSGSECSASRSCGGSEEAEHDHMSGGTGAKSTMSASFRREVGTRSSVGRDGPTVVKRSGASSSLDLES